MNLFKRLLPLLIILVGIGLFDLFGFERYLSLEEIRVHHQEIKDTLSLYPVVAPLIFISAYSLFATLSIPGGIFLSLLGGYLFPLPFSTIYVVIAETLGASVIFTATKMASGAIFKEDVKPFLKKIKQGFQRNGVSYMLFLRFVPFFPFWVVNVAPALLGLSTKTFIWTTFIGIIPNAFAFTYAGQGLDKILENKETFSSELITITEFKIGLIALGVLCLLPAFIRDWNKKRK